MFLVAADDRTQAFAFEFEVYEDRNVGLYWYRLDEVAHLFLYNRFAPSCFGYGD